MPRDKRLRISELTKEQQKIINELVLNDCAVNADFLDADDSAKAIIIRTYLNFHDDDYISKNLDKIRNLALQIAQDDLREDVLLEINELFYNLKDDPFKKRKAPDNEICISLKRYFLDEKFDKSDFVSTQIFQHYLTSQNLETPLQNGVLINFANSKIPRQKQIILTKLLQKFLERKNATTTELMVLLLPILDRDIARELLFEPSNMAKLENIFYENIDKIRVIMARENGIRDFNLNLAAILNSNLDISDKIFTAIASASFSQTSDQILARFYYEKIYFPLRDEYEENSNRDEIDHESHISQSMISTKNLIKYFVENFSTSKSDKNGFRFIQKDFRDYVKARIGADCDQFSEYEKAKYATYLLLKDSVIKFDYSNFLKNNNAFKELEQSTRPIKATAISRLSGEICRIL